MQINEMRDARAGLSKEFTSNLVLRPLVLVFAENNWGQTPINLQARIN